MIQSDAVPIVPLADGVEKGEKALSALEGLSFDDAIAKIASALVDFGAKLLLAVLVLYVGKFIINRLYKFTYSTMVRHNADASLTTFVLSLVKMILYFILIVTIIGILGLETSSFLALFASAGVAIGMALSGTLQNFAGGVLILLLKPYKVGDYIETQGYSGTVKSIQIFNTIINTPDNKAIIIPNGGLSTGSINNFSLEQYRRVDWTIGLSYGDDFDKAADLIKQMLLEDDRVVVKYIEDDKARRIQMHLDSIESDKDNTSAGSLSAPVEKVGNWWQRYKMRRKARRNKIALELKARQNFNAGMPQKINCEPFVALNELADSSINITVRAWTHVSNYWGLYFDMNRRFYNELPQKGFSFPFPQMDVHLNQNS